MNVLPDDARILRVLLESESEFLTMEELASRTSISALLLRLQQLEQVGYVFGRHPVLGMRLAGTPSRLVGDEILARMQDPGWIREILVFAETRSTNDLINQLGDAGADSGTVVFAEAQSAGRGRFGRQWHSAPGSGLWFSILLRPTISPGEFCRYTLATALAVGDGIREATGLVSGIKWPNDLLIGGKKICGILLENRGFLTVGIGLNVNQEHFPEELAPRATSLRLAGVSVSRTTLAAAILDTCARRFQQVESDFDALLGDYRAHCVSLGHYVSLKGGGGREHQGIAVDVDETGKLGIRGDAGHVQWFAEGEVQGA